MKQLNSTALKVDQDRISILDQTRLPNQEIWLEIPDPDAMVGAIRRLSVRGAPLISIAACVSLALHAAKIESEGVSGDEFAINIRETAERLRESRPTAVNLMLALDRMVFRVAPESLSTAHLIATAERIFEDDLALCEAIATHGQQVIEDGDAILTHCNTGGLGTTGIGTAIGVIRKAHELGKRIHVYVDETRPLLQGGRLTTWELDRAGVPYTLICDNMAAGLMRDGKIQRAIVGADRVALNGDFANKTGTYSVAVLCDYHRVPFYCAAPFTTVDPECANGDTIPIELRDGDEVRGFAGTGLVWSPAECQVYNPAFDVTPGKLLTGLILDSGYYPSDAIEAGALTELFAPG
ncbi:MAG: S-methyl-5-thioribose-1-phosphate isomerase [bacterium]|nr:S-methyl-5-thioribose-1-phosphate isomerase [bacterium]